jgi:hypothetical protein
MGAAAQPDLKRDGDARTQPPGEPDHAVATDSSGPGASRRVVRVSGQGGRPVAAAIDRAPPVQRTVVASARSARLATSLARDFVEPPSSAVPAGPVYSWEAPSALQEPELVPLKPLVARQLPLTTSSDRTVPEAD